MVVFVYALLIVLLLSPGWRLLQILTVAVAVLVTLIGLIDPIPMGLFPAIILHSAVFFGLGALIVRLMGPKPGADGEASRPPSKS